jgi:hypothetical protein
VVVYGACRVPVALLPSVLEGHRVADLLQSGHSARKYELLRTPIRQGCRINHSGRLMLAGACTVDVGPARRGRCGREVDKSKG